MLRHGQNRLFLSQRSVNAMLMLALLIFAPSSVYALAVPPSVSAQWLKLNLGRPGLSLIELSDEAEYQFNGHIPGAVGSGKSDWRYAADDGTLVHYSPEVLAEKLRRLGVNDSDGVVIYYKGNNTDEILGAFYLYWLFHLLGHPNVGVLDQGWHGWLSIGGPIENDPAEITPGNFVARPLLALEIGTDELNRIRGNYLLVDGRPRGHFAGRTKFPANPRYGRIPGSVNQPWRDYMRRGKDGHWYAEAPDIPPLLKALKVPRNTPILLTCLGGTGAAFNYAMFYAAGYHNLRLHDAGLRRWNTRRLPLEMTNVHGHEPKN